MPTRPIAVTAIAWLLIALAVLGLAMLLAVGGAVGRGSSFMPTVLAGAGALVIQIVAAVGMLKGRNWARLLFLWLTPLSIAIGLLAAGRVNPVEVIKTGLYLVFAFFLTRPVAVSYFIVAADSGTDSSERASGSIGSSPTLKFFAQLASAGCFLFALFVIGIAIFVDSRIDESFFVGLGVLFATALLSFGLSKRL